MVSLSPQVLVEGGVLLGLWGTLLRRDVAVTAEMVAATLPWYAIVGVAYAIRQAISLPGVLAVLLKSPTAFLTIGVIVAALWILLAYTGMENHAFVTVASGLLVLIALGLGISLLGNPQSTVLLWEGVAVGIAIAITILVWAVFVRRWDHSIVGWLGVSVLFAHTLDATTTGVGLTILGVNERNPLSAFIIQTANAVGPMGVGVIVFLLVKVGVALLIASVLRGSTVESRRDTAGLLVVAAGAGLAPAVHNLVLFALTVH